MDELNNLKDVIKYALNSIDAGVSKEEASAIIIEFVEKNFIRIENLRHTDKLT